MSESFARTWTDLFPPFVWVTAVCTTSVSASLLLLRTSSPTFVSVSISISINCSLFREFVKNFSLEAGIFFSGRTTRSLHGCFRRKRCSWSFGLGSRYSSKTIKHFSEPKKEKYWSLKSIKCSVIVVVFHWQRLQVEPFHTIFHYLLSRLILVSR